WPRTPPGKTGSLPRHAPTARRPTRPSSTLFSTAPPNSTHASSISLGRTMSGLAPPSGGPGTRSSGSPNTSKLQEQASLQQFRLLGSDRPLPLTRSPPEAPSPLVYLFFPSFMTFFPLLCYVFFF